MRKNGFSLIELIVAMAIVSMGISLANLVYANYIKMDEKFALQAHYYSELPEAVEEIRERVKNGSETGSLAINKLVCKWSLSKKESTKKKVFSISSSVAAESAETYFLNHVLVNCSIGARELEEVTVMVLTYDLTDFGTGFTI